MSYSAVGSPVKTQHLGNASGISLSVSPTAIGDVLVAFIGDCGYHNVRYPANSTNDYPVSTVSGGGVTTWNKLAAQGVGTQYGTDSEIWWGVITATGASTLTINYAGTSSYQQLFVQQFNSSTTGTWTAAASPLQTTIAETGTSFTGLAASVSGQLYLACQSNLSINETITLSGGTAGEYPGGGSVIYAWNLAPGTTSQSPSWPSGTGQSTYTDAQVAGFLYVASSSSSSSGFFAYFGPM